MSVETLLCGVDAMDMININSISAGDLEQGVAENFSGVSTPEGMQRFVMRIAEK